jgi:chromosome segregation ATPase
MSGATYDIKLMGSKKPKKDKVQAYNLETTKQSEALTQQYQQQLGAIQQQSQQTIESINQQNQQAQQLIQQQLQAAQQEKQNYQESLKQYLAQLNDLQGKYTQALGDKESSTQAIQDTQKKEIEANTLMQSLMNSSAVAKYAFGNKTSRKSRGVIV